MKTLSMVCPAFCYSNIFVAILFFKCLDFFFFRFYIDWRCIAERDKFADAVLICTPDRLHKVCGFYVPLVNVHMIEFS